jgi:hypothetical protein
VPRQGFLRRVGYAVAPPIEEKIPMTDLCKYCIAAPQHSRFL